ncbi:MAG: hypothetical protein KF696_01130 [Planctomycetes bacterium]|nr:hypothetical protein [Planctomycetota bacterium]MCW8134458.1 hypothetical protein [Planctomycetota bacterium]
MTEQAVATPAFDTDDVQQARRTARKVRTSYQPVEEFVKEVRDMQERAKDFLVPYKNLRCKMVTIQSLTNEGVEDRFRLMLELIDVPGLNANNVLSAVSLSLYEHVLTQLCQHTAIGEKAGVPTMYLKRLLSDNSDRGLVALAAVNVQELLSRRYGEKHTRGKAGEEKAVFVRTFRTDDGYKCRALLSDRYFPIRTLDMVTIALGLATGKIGGGNKGDGGDSAITGAFMFDQHLSVTGCTLGLVNPNFAFDLRNPDRGILHAERITQAEGGQPVYHYPGGASYALGGRFNVPHDNPNQHLVLPAARISNSETGGGSAEIQPMLFETICTNGVVFAKALKRTHVSSIISEADEYESDGTKKKAMEWVISKMTDAMKQVFDLNSFEDNCRKFLKLKDTELKSDRVKEVTEHLISAIPGGDGLLDDILKSMEQFTPGRTTLLDVTRALTSVAQDQPHDRQVAMEELAGALATGETKVGEKFVLFRPRLVSTQAPQSRAA